LASLHAVVQKVDLLANFPFLRGHPAAACIVFPDRSAASAASAGRDVVRRQSAARFPASFQEPVRDSPLASAAKVRQDALQSHRVPQPPGAH